MLEDYFSGLRMRFSTNSYTTDWINLDIGIAMGCTISPNLFVIAMEVILKAAEDSAGPANLGGGCYMPPLKAFMANQQIPMVSQELVKSLGRWYDSSMKDTTRGLEIVEPATEGLLAINRCGLQGKLKVWCLQFMLIPKLLWPLLVYEISSRGV